MPSLAPMSAALEAELKALRRRIQFIKKILKNLRQLERSGSTGSQKAGKHSAESRKRIGAAKRKWWKKRKALLKEKS